MVRHLRQHRTIIRVGMWSQKEAWQSLNEGRGVCPGDTAPRAAIPGDLLRRSTKAGASAPATPSARLTVEPSFSRRSTKAGASAPATRTSGIVCSVAILIAQRRPGRLPRRHLDPNPNRKHPCATLNEGRGVCPGDTRQDSDVVRQFQLRSTKAGASAPATPLRQVVDMASGEDAQRRPGRLPRRHMLFKPAGKHCLNAQRRPGRLPRRHWHPRSDLLSTCSRSTKAGASAPATPPPPPACTPARIPAQRRPGRLPRRHHFRRRIPQWRPSIAQRRPGRLPRRHPLGCIHVAKACSRSTKAGASAPATLTQTQFLSRVMHRSTKAGASAPATLGPAKPARHG